MPNTSTHSIRRVRYFVETFIPGVGLAVELPDLPPNEGPVNGPHGEKLVRMFVRVLDGNDHPKRHKHVTRRNKRSR